MADVVAFPHDYGGHHTVLVVDDDAAIRAMLSEFLESCGYRTVTAHNAEAAITALQTGTPIDLVFSDVHMPGKLDGYGLARWITDNKAGLPLILVSGDLGKTNAVLELSRADIMPKPYDLDTAVRKIREILNRNFRRRGE